MREGNNKHPDDEKSLETGDGGGGGGGGNGSGSASGSHHYHNYHFFCKFVDFRIIILFLVVALSCLVLYQSAYPFQFFYRSSANLSSDKEDKLESVLREAAMIDKTVIVTTLNDAWAEPDSIFDVFLESFRIGNQTERLLNNLVVVALDQKAYARCLAVHPHCYALVTRGTDFSKEAFFMTSDYLKMVWRKIELQHNILVRGYNMIFTDADIMWFRDPYAHFDTDADFQISCDYFRGNSSDIYNSPNSGFIYAKSNHQTIQFYKFWHTSRERFPGLHDQDVLNKLRFDPFTKNNTELEIRFLDTAYFGGFCQPSRNLNEVCTMHANCCVGLDNKVNDLRIMLEDWRKYMALTVDEKASKPSSWTVPQNCSTSFSRPHKSQNQNNDQGSNN